MSNRADKQELEAKWGRLMRDAQDGNSVSYNTLLSELVPHIRSFCRQKVSYLDLSDDVVQEALVAVHRFRHTYDPKRPFLPWLNTLVRHKIIDSVRRRTRVMNNEVFSSEAIDEAPAKPAQDSSSAGELKNLLEVLPEEYRRPLELLKLQELSVEEVAAKLGLSSSAVKMRVHRAFKLLKKKAERDVYEE